MKKYWNHFKIITNHKYYVFKACIKVGIIWRGIVHDLSKYSITEFFTSARYFQGNSSPINAEKRRNGFSLAWLHHKGKNKHHWEYWLDYKNGEVIPVKMPIVYVKEMLCDWIGAGKAYIKDKWSISSLKVWYRDNSYKMILHPKTEFLIELAMTCETEKELYQVIKKLDKIRL